MKVKAKTIIYTAPKYLGVPYSTMDCQAFVEKVLKDCGIKKNLEGSNTWYRFALENGWVGSPEECRKKFGKIPKGAFLFILKKDGKEPEKYKNDGIGNASHIGIYTGQSAGEMLDEAFAAQEIEDADERRALIIKASHGDGAINSSYKWECVATSNFEGKSINGGWNRVWLWTDMIDYDEEEDQGKMELAKVVLPVGSSGKTVNMREGPNIKYGIEARVPVGQMVSILEDQGQWCKIQYDYKTGWMQSNYLEYTGQADETNQDQLTNEQLREIGKALETIMKATSMLNEALETIPKFSV